MARRMIHGTVCTRTLRQLSPLAWHCADAHPASKPLCGTAVIHSLYRHPTQNARGQTLDLPHQGRRTWARWLPLASILQKMSAPSHTLPLPARHAP
jgi:hypothetical protein